MRMILKNIIQRPTASEHKTQKNGDKVKRTIAKKLLNHTKANGLQTSYK